MFLQKVIIQNFRCLRELSVTLAPGLNVIVGENNSGKTAFLDAIRAALGPAAATGDSIRLGPDDRHRAVDGKYTDAPISVTLIFAGLTVSEQGQFIDILNYDPAAPADSTAQINFLWTWNSGTERYSIRRWGGAATHSESGSRRSWRVRPMRSGNCATSRRQCQVGGNAKQIRWLGHQRARGIDTETTGLRWACL